MIKTKQYIFQYPPDNGGDFVEIPNSSNKAFMTGFIIPITNDNIPQLSSVSIQHEYIHNLIPIIDVYSLDDIKTNIPIIMPFNNSIPNGYYNFDNVFIELSEKNLASPISMFYSNNVTLPNISYINNTPCIVLCHNKSSKLIIEWNDVNINLGFQDHINPIIGFSYYYMDNIGSLRYKTNQTLMIY